MQERGAKDLGRRWRAWPSRHDPGSSEPARKEELSAKFLKDTCSGCPGRLGWAGFSLGRSRLMESNSASPSAPSPPEWPLIAHQEDGFSSPLPTPPLPRRGRPEPRPAGKKSGSKVNRGAGPGIRALAESTQVGLRGSSH